jgi:hypothetical protein
MPSASDPTHCRFLSSLGGTYRCQDPAFREGFCRFHFEAFLRGEVLVNGQLDEHLADQHRRREINYHGIPPELASPFAEPVHR